MAKIALASAPAAVAAAFQELAPLIDRAIGARTEVPTALAEGDPERRLAEAMRYAALSPGKRIRPALTLLVCDAVGGSPDAAMPAAVAVEVLHAYTLVHDDLPAMDDDELRRGKPTVHIAYDEATAILAGDGLLTLAFECLADLGAHAAAAVRCLSRAAGGAELLAGQALDLSLEDDASPDTDTLERIHRKKTGALFSAAAELGAICAGVGDDVRAAAASYGLYLGVAFQHADDLDDGEFAAQAERAKTRRTELATAALAAARTFGDGGSLLAEVARWVGDLSDG